MSSSQVNSQLWIDGHDLRLDQLVHAARNVTKIAVSQEVESRVSDSCELLDSFIKSGRIIYGVNTGLGGMVNWLVPESRCRELQEHLISSVATNVGSYLSDDVVRACMLARINSLARGASAISLLNFRKLIAMYNLGIVPCIPSKGSLGASGDLGPLACIALVGTGKWKARYNGEVISGQEALQQAGLEPMCLSYKEGLSLINGTSAMVALGSIVTIDSIALMRLYDVISTVSLEALKATKKPFDPVVHAQKPHKGQLQTATNIWRLLSDSNMIANEADIESQLRKYSSTAAVETNYKIEDAYSIRCTPQIAGPIRDNIKHVSGTITDELNSSNDNPLIICEHSEIYHNGHFHGQYIAMAMDQLAISLTTLSNLSDRRIDRFMDRNNSNGLPAFLCTNNAGLRLGLMGGQFMATSLTAENRALCHPSSTQSLPSTGYFQDIVSMGLVAARRAAEIHTNTVYIVAVELICALQAAEIRGFHLLSTVGKCVFDYVRRIVPPWTRDLVLTDYVEELSDVIKSGALLQHIETLTGPIPF